MSKKDILNVIVVASNPQGKFVEGYISGTPLPGVRMQRKAGVAERNGRFTYEVFNGAADADRKGPTLILREDELQGKGVDEAYQDGKRGFMYIPAEGEEMLIRVSAPGTGTGDNFAVSDQLMVNDGDGTYVASSGTGETEEFEVAEDIDDVEAGGTLVLCTYNGR